MENFDFNREILDFSTSYKLFEYLIRQFIVSNLYRFCHCVLRYHSVELKMLHFISLDYLQQPKGE